MNAREKFIKRLEEEGLYEEWNKTGDFASKVKEDGSIVLFSHYEWDADDNYVEDHYASFNELRDDEEFQKFCKESFFENDDDTFVANLARWLNKDTDECPLYPVDLYFCDAKESIIFEDDIDDGYSRVIVEMLRYMADKTGLEIKGKINNIEI